MFSNKVRVILVGIIVIFVTYYLFKNLISIERIDAGCSGIRVNLVGNNKGVDDITEVTGYVFYMPIFTAIYEFPTYTQSKDYPEFKVNSKDGSEFIVDPIFSYYVDTKFVPSIFKHFRKTLPELEDGYLRNVIFDCYRIAANGFSSDSLVSNRQIFEEDVQNRLIGALKTEGFVFQQLTSNLEPPASLKAAIDAKNKTIQESMQAENKIRQAEADAKVLKVRTDAEKYQNETKTNALSPLVIQQIFLEKWDGKLPIYGEVPKLFKNITQ
jgi:hypothetical protein